MQSAPLSVIVIEVIRHTPLYVWAILAGLVVLGTLQMQERVMTRARVLALPIGLGAYSLLSAGSAFGAHWEVFAAWAIGMAGMLWAARWIAWPRSVHYLADRDVFAVGGSPWPLVVMLAVFAARYLATVTLILNPQWRQLAGVAIVGGLGYGLLAGVFALRARNILIHGGASRRLLAA